MRTGDVGCGNFKLEKAFLKKLSKLMCQFFQLLTLLAFFSDFC